MNMDNDLWVTDLEAGSGSLKHYTYFANGLRLHTKRNVYEAIKLKLSCVIRKDKIMGSIEKFNYSTMRFEVSK